jgi:hypothetical protein
MCHMHRIYSLFHKDNNTSDITESLGRKEITILLNCFFYSQKKPAEDKFNQSLEFF